MILDDRQFVFIIGADRSGTTWLQSLIGAHPDVTTTVQLTIFQGYVASWVETFRREQAYMDDPRHWAQGLPVVWSENEFHQFLRDFLDNVYGRVLQRNPEATHVLDKHPAYRDHVDSIKRLIPHAKIIHVIRDGRDVVVSSIHSLEGLGFGYLDVSSAILAWESAVQAGRSAARYEGDYLEVRYEDLHSNGRHVLEQTFEFCGLSASDEQIVDILAACDFGRMRQERRSPDSDIAAPPAHFRGGRVGDWRDELSVGKRLRIERLSGAVLREFGYSETGWWKLRPFDAMTGPLSEFCAGAGRRLRRAWNALLGKTSC
jgi:hypothetical protein